MGLTCTLCGAEVEGSYDKPVVSIPVLKFYTSWARDRAVSPHRTKHFWCAEHLKTFYEWMEAEHDAHYNGMADQQGDRPEQGEPPA